MIPDNLTPHGDEGAFPIIDSMRRREDREIRLTFDPNLATLYETIVTLESVVEELTRQRDDAFRLLAEARGTLEDNGPFLGGKG